MRACNSAQRGSYKFTAGLGLTTVERLLRGDERDPRGGTPLAAHATLATVRHIVGGECPAVAAAPTDAAEALYSVVSACTTTG